MPSGRMFDPSHPMTNDWRLPCGSSRTSGGWTRSGVRRATSPFGRVLRQSCRVEPGYRPPDGESSAPRDREAALTGAGSSSVLPEHGRQCSQQNDGVADWRPILDILHIEAHHVVKGEPAAPADLPQT